MPDGGLGGSGGGGIGTGGGQGAGSEDPGAPVTLVTEELEWRRRAIAAEERVGALEKELEDTRRSMQAAELRSRLEREAQALDPVDLEAAVLLAQAAMAGAEAPDVGATLRDLKRRKPFLFRAGAPASAMAPDAGAGDDASLARALEEARLGGDRRALLRYLRMRRNA